MDSNPNNITQGDLIIVYWWDTEDDSSWQLVQLLNYIKPPLAKHVGWFLSEDADCIRILPAIIGEDEKMEAGSSIIPKKSIKKIEKVRDDELDVSV